MITGNCKYAYMLTKVRLVLLVALNLNIVHKTCSPHQEESRWMLLQFQKSQWLLYILYITILYIIRQ